MTASVSETIAAAERQFDDGDWEAALVTLTEGNRARRCAELDVALADLRHRAWPFLAGGADSARVEPSIDGPAIGSSGLPEADLAHLVAADIRHAILNHGCLLLRNALPPDIVASTRNGIDAATAAALADDRARPSTWRPLDVRKDVLATMATPPRPLRRSFVHEAGGVLMADAPGAMFDLLEHFERLGLRTMVGEFLGSRPVMSAHKCTLRRVPAASVGGWHQDGAFLGAGVRALNIWIALTDCGIDAPGLDIIPRRLDHIVETGTTGAYFDWAVSDLVADEIAGDGGIVRPRFSAGDMVMFDEMLLHRTATTPSMAIDRYAIEFWNFSAGAYPEGQIPLVW